MADSLLQSLDLIQANSIVNVASLFLYGVHNGTPYNIDGLALSNAVLGLPSRFTTVYRASSWDLNDGVFVDIPWTDTFSDAPGWKDVNSSNLLRITDDKTTMVQLMVQLDLENSLFGWREAQINAGGLPSPVLTNPIGHEIRDFNDSIWNTNIINQAITPPIKVQSGSYFWVQAKQTHSVPRQIAGGNTTWFSMWSWEGN